MQRILDINDIKEIEAYKDDTDDIIHAFIGEVDTRNTSGTSKADTKAFIVRQVSTLCSNALCDDMDMVATILTLAGLDKSLVDDVVMVLSRSDERNEMQQVLGSWKAKTIDARSAAQTCLAMYTNITKSQVSRTESLGRSTEENAHIDFVNPQENDVKMDITISCHRKRNWSHVWEILFCCGARSHDHPGLCLSKPRWRKRTPSFVSKS